MTFELTDSLIDNIIFAMEDQNLDFVYNAEKDEVVSTDDLFGSEVDELDEKEAAYSLPDWSSNDGFNLMEEFAEDMRSPNVREELLQALSNRRGVFRDFKNVLAKYPHIEKRFFDFKESKMRSVVYEWYNSLRESWGLEKLSQEFDDFDELTKADFEFKPYNHQKDNDCVIQEAKKIADELKNDFSGEKGSVAAHLWLRKFSFKDSGEVTGIVARTLSDEFAGSLLFERFPSFSQKTVALIAFFVNQNYRGLGICRELFSQCISNFKNLGIHEFIIADSVPDYIEPLLARCGFEKKGSVYVLDSADKN